MNHKALCAKNMVCAVYHENGICPDKKECTCGADTLSQSKKEEGWALENITARFAERVKTSFPEEIEIIIAAERASLIEKIEGMYRGGDAFSQFVRDAEAEGYNQALDDILSLLKTT